MGNLTPFWNWTHIAEAKCNRLFECFDDKKRVITLTDITLFFNDKPERYYDFDSNDIILICDHANSDQAEAFKSWITSILPSADMPITMEIKTESSFIAQDEAWLLHRNSN